MKKFKILFLITLCLFIKLSSIAETLQCSIEKVWTVDSARDEAFKDLKPTLDLSWAPAIDPNFIENKQAINNHKESVKDRVITLFDDGSYGIWVLDEDNYDKVYYYFSSGELVAIDFSIFPTYIKDLQSYFTLQDNMQIFPIKIYKHAYPGGKIINVTLTVKDCDSYMFEPSGALQYHWIGNNCYDNNGKIILTRNIST